MFSEPSILPFFVVHAVHGWLELTDVCRLLVHLVLVYILVFSGDTSTNTVPNTQHQAQPEFITWGEPYCIGFSV